jgi:hypothetical protein
MKILWVLTLAFALQATTYAQAKSWSQAMADVEELLDRYEAAARIAIVKEAHTEGEEPRGIDEYFGNTGNRIDQSTHLCAILGRRLGFVEEIVHLEPPLPAMDSDSYTLARTVYSLRNWLSAAGAFGEMSQPERAQYWNLECLANPAIGVRSYHRAANNHVFFALDDQYLIIYGQIVEGYSSKLIDVLNQNPQVKAIRLGSGGGSVAEAMRAGTLIRQRGLRTEMQGPCFSACPLVFAGGVERLQWGEGYNLGFHQVSTGASRQPIPLKSSIYEEIAVYLDGMGVNGSWAVMQMQDALPSEMKYLGDTDAESELLCKMGFVTAYLGSGKC